MPKDSSYAHKGLMTNWPTTILRHLTFTISGFCVLVSGPLAAVSNILCLGCAAMATVCGMMPDRTLITVRHFLHWPQSGSQLDKVLCRPLLVY
jgi:hypothetical protein